MWDFNDFFLDNEDIVAKLEHINEQTTRYPYQPWKGEASDYGQRVERALLEIPTEHHEAALALFSNIIYLPDALLDETWREIGFELETREGWVPETAFDHSLFMAVDDPGLVAKFGHVNGIKGREDRDKNPDFGTVSELIGQLKNSVVVWDQEGLERLRLACSKKQWILLTDNAISGGSLKSDIEKLNQILDLLFENLTGQYTERPSIFACAQIITEQALGEALRLLPAERIFYGLLFDERFRVNSDKCALFHKPATLDKVRRLCEWFGEKYFIQNLDDRFRMRIQIHQEKGGQRNYAYGWRDCDYTIVTQNNCLSNSVPVLYYLGNTPNGTYYPPLPRIESRESHVTSQDRGNLQTITEASSTDKLREAIWEN